MPLFARAITSQLELLAAALVDEHSVLTWRERESDRGLFVYAEKSRTLAGCRIH
jgi:hypothetical protein